MDDFHRRHTLDDAERIWRVLGESGLVDAATRSVIVHDLDEMRRRLGTLQRVFPASTLHALAIKANPTVEILRAAVAAGAGLEAASIEEVHLALAAGCPPSRIVFDSPAKTVDEIREALERGLHLNADNLDELQRIDSVIGEARADRRGVIGLRITPDVAAGSIAQTSVGNRGSRFGVSLSSRRAGIVAAFERYPWLSGLHVHVGSQGCALDSLVDAVAKVFGLRTEIEESVGPRIDVIDIGGGLPTAYVSEDVPPTPSEYFRRLVERVPGFVDSGTRLVTEFGRAVQAGCGLAFSRVESVRPDQGMAVMHLGADFLMRPAYRPEDWRHEFFVLGPDGRRKDAPRRPVTLLGPLCFSGDVIARGVELPTIEPGDRIVVRDVGAYTLGMWSRHCNRGIPAVLGCEPSANPPARILRAEESPEDVVRFWS